MLGSVGAYDWSGGLFLYGSGSDPEFINVTSSTKDMNDAYLGKSPKATLYTFPGMLWGCVRTVGSTFLFLSLVGTSEQCFRIHFFWMKWHGRVLASGC